MSVFAALFGSSGQATEELSTGRACNVAHSPYHHRREQATEELPAWIDLQAHVSLDQGQADLSQTEYPIPDPVHPSPYGEQAFGLTRFGDTWLNLNMLMGVEFKPADKCGCEVSLRDAGSESLTFHLSAPDAAGLKEYLKLAATGKIPNGSDHVPFDYTEI